MAFYRHLPVLVLLLSAALGAQVGPDVLERGVPASLASERASTIGNLRYELEFVVPDARSEPVEGRVAVRFTLTAPQRIVLDFAQPADSVRRVTSQGLDVSFEVENGHLTVSVGSTRAGENILEVEFVAGDEPLNRNDEFLYTLFVPARAHLAFPCFDQPNLKARYSLSLDVPSGWTAVANGAERRTESDGSRTRVQFEETPPLSTYLFGFATGVFSVETAERDGRQMRMFHRETDAAKVARNLDAIFDLHALALDWLEQYTAIPYPWAKFDFVLIPSFQFGGMEHAGAVLYNATGLLLDESATQNQFLNRASLIAHETAHMWFGDLVTMEWFDDVWMKEVFANFMAAKIVGPSFPDVDHELRFLLAHYPQAYQVDRTAGTNPVRQGLANLDEAGQLYGAIIYQKAPIVMRQLEMTLGDEAFRDGLREYLKTYAFGNATWLDLVRMLDRRTPEDIAGWSRAWVEERGRPEFTTTVETDETGEITNLVVTMRDPLGRGLVWPQRLIVTLGYAGSAEQIAVTVAAESTVVREAIGKGRPLYVLPTGGGLGYGLFELDPTTRTYLLDHVEDIPDALARGSAWVTLWDNVLEGLIAPSAFVETIIRAVPGEADEQNVQRVLSYLRRAFWRFMPERERSARAPELERMLRAGIDRATTSSQQSAWFSAYRDVVLTEEGVAWLERVWRREERIAGLPFAETDEIAMALELAVREVPEWQAVLQQQLERTENPDRKARFAFVMPALSADAAVREQAFKQFGRIENRRREPWVLESMAYLNHPLRETHARRFVRPSLDLLREIQMTGDIFFPGRWMDSALGGHRSPAVAAIVREFLDGEPNYPERLRWTILSSADELFRAAGALP